MIPKVYSECNNCLGADEEKLKLAHKVKSINDLLEKNIPKSIKMKILRGVKPNGPGSSEKWLNGKNINDCLKRFIDDIPEYEKILAQNDEKQGGCHGKHFFECQDRKRELAKREPIYVKFSMRDFDKYRGPLSYVKAHPEHKLINTKYGETGGSHNPNFNSIKTANTLNSIDHNTSDGVNIPNVSYNTPNSINGIRYKGNCFGTVLNTDYSTGGGIHWVAIFVNMIEMPYTFEYFDSGGSQVMPEIEVFFRRLKSVFPEAIIINVSRRVQQKNNHACGAYALYYVYSRYQGVPWTYFRDYIVGDDLMTKFRKHLFSLVEE